METLTDSQLTVPAVIEDHPVMTSQIVAAPDAKQLRTEQVGNLLGKAYAKASTLKLKREEWTALRAEFPDEAIEIRREKNREVIYIGHMELRERLWSVFHPGEIAEICREKMLRTDTNEIVVDLVLMVRGVFVAEAIGRAKYYPNNASASYADSIESAWSDALRKCCKHFGIGTQAWRKSFIRAFMDRHATARQEQREEKAGKVREYKLDPEKRATSAPEIDDDIPF